MKRHSKMWVAVLGLALCAGALSACDTSSGGPYAGGWYDVYGDYCGGGMPTPGCDYFWNGSKATIWDDPFWTGQGDPSGWWQSPDGVIYDGGWAINDGSDSGSRDLIGDVAAQEQRIVEKAGRAFAARYALSEDTGIRLARTLHEWASLSANGRARTDADVADFSRRLYGIPADQALAALNAAKGGDASGLEQASSEIATFWGATPETTRTILRNWYRDQLSEYGAR